MVSVLIGMNNSWGMVAKDTFYSMLAMSLYSQKAGIETHMHDPDDHIIYHARNKLGRFAIQENHDFILYADADMTWPPYTLEYLVNWDLAVVSGWYCQQAWPHRIYIMYENPDKEGHYLHIHANAESLKRRTLLKCDAVGAGCLLVRTSTLRAIKEAEGWEDGEEQWFGWIDGGKSDDIWFCELARKHEYSIFVDTAILCGHINTIVYPYHVHNSAITRQQQTFYFSGGYEPTPMTGELNFEFLKHHPSLTDPDLISHEVKASDLKEKGLNLIKQELAYESALKKRAIDKMEKDEKVKESG
jgi:hypothetical protein